MRSAEGAGPRRLRPALANRGTSSSGPTRRGWISSSPSATRCRARPAPISARRPSPPPGRCPTRPSSAAVAAERATLLNELYARLRRRLEVFTSLPFGSLDRMALQERGWTSMRRQPSAHQCVVPEARPMRVGINGMGRIGRLALRAALGAVARQPERSARAATGSTSCTSTRSRAVPRRPRICWNSTASMAAGASRDRRRGRQRDPHRQPAHRLSVATAAARRRALGRSRLRHRAGMHRQVPDAGGTSTAISSAA